MKNITKLTPDPGAKDYDVVNMAGTEVYIHGATPPYDVISPADSLATDIAFYDQTQNKVIIARVKDYSRLPKSLAPIGIVIVPGTHDVYGDGSCGVMSLKDMDCNAPDAGSVLYPTMFWGHYNNDISNLPNLDEAPIVGRGTNVGNENSIVVGVVNYARLPSDRFGAVQCPHDINTYYPYSDNSINQAPSPYLTDNSRNPAYYQTTSPSSLSNCLADFNGRVNSEILWSLATAQNSWKTDPTITDNSDSNYLPAACCCWRYHTNGTQQGDWYLPAMGELGYILPPFNNITRVMSHILNRSETSTGSIPSAGNGYWSSSQYSSDAARYIQFGSGGISSFGKRNSVHVRAFLRIGPNGIVR